MIIAITAQGPSPHDAVDQRFGRAPYHVILDSETGEYSALDNTKQMAASQGAGVQSAQNVVSCGARILLTGHCGPKAFAVLSSAGVGVFSGVAGTVVDAVAAWRAGGLTELTHPDATPHR
jgi:predicted Fe-Mo cluster-binding NifX family protein